MSTIKYPDPVTGAWKLAGGIPPDAPSDGQIYGRRNGAWVPVTASVVLSGFAMVGPIVDLLITSMPSPIGKGWVLVNYV